MLSGEELEALRPYLPLRWFRAAVVYLDYASGIPYYWRLARWAPLPKQDAAWFNSLGLATAAQIRGRTGFPGLVASMQAQVQAARKVPVCIAPPSEVRTNEHEDSLLHGKLELGDAHAAATSPRSEKRLGHCREPDNGPWRGRSDLPTAVVFKSSLRGGVHAGQPEDFKDQQALCEPEMGVANSVVRSLCGNENDLLRQGKFEPLVATASESSSHALSNLRAEGHPGLPTELDDSPHHGQATLGAANAAEPGPYTKAEAPALAARTSSREQRFREARRPVPIKHTFVHFGAPVPRSLSF